MTMKKFSGFLLMACLLLALLPAAAFAASNVSYIAANGITQNCTNATDIGSSTTTWGTSGNTTWYYVGSDVTIGSRVSVNGNVHLILGSNATLTVNGGISVTGQNSIAIYGQSIDSGRLVANGSDGCAGIGGNNADGLNAGAITINSGTIVAEGGGYAAGIGGGNQGNSTTININGGVITANGRTAAAAIGGGTHDNDKNVGGNGGSINISGGHITVKHDNTPWGAPNLIGSGDNGGTANVTIQDAVVCFVFEDNQSSRIYKYPTNTDISSGVEFVDDNGSITSTVKGMVTTKYTIPVPAGSSLTIPAGTALNGTGTIDLTDGGTLSVNGTLGSGMKLKVNVSANLTNLTGITSGNASFSGNYAAKLAPISGYALPKSITVKVGNTTLSAGDYTYNSATGDLSIPKNKITQNFEVTASGVPCLAAPSNLQWSAKSDSSATANWSSVNGASSYKVQLYKDGTAQGSEVTSNGTSHTLSISAAGSYTFKVKAVGNGTSNADSVYSSSSALNYYTVSFAAGGGTGSMNSVIKVQGDSYVLPNNGFTRPVYKVFAGWQVSSATYQPGSSISINGNTTVTALWKDDTVASLTPSGTLTKSTYTYGDAFELAGVTVTATYTQGGTKDVTNAVTFDSKLSAGQTEITLNYGGKTCEVDGFTVVPRPVTVSGITANSKTYDSTTAATLNCANAVFTDKLSGDALTITATGKFVDKNVGDSKTVNISSLADDGQQETATASITAKNITVTITPNGGVYGGTITPAAAALNGLEGSDTSAITFTYTGTANDGTTIQQTEVPTLAGTYSVTASISDANYNLTGPTSAQFIISSRALTAPTIELSQTSFVYNGSEQKPTVTVKDGSDTLTEGTDYDVKWPADCTSAERKTISITFKGNYSGTAESEYEIVQSATQITPNLDHADSVYTYGEIITVTAEAKPSGVIALGLRSLTAPAANQMALFMGDTQISDAADVNAQGQCTLTYNTANKDLVIGENTLTVKYVGNANMADQSANVTVTLKPKELTITGMTAKNREYEPGNQQVEITGAELSGKVDANDDVSVNLNDLHAAVSSANAGTYNEAVIPQTVPLTGLHAAYYFVKGSVSVSITPGVEITRATPYTLNGQPAQPLFSNIYRDGYTLSGVPVSLPDGTFNVPGTIQWEAPGETLIEEGKPYTWVFIPTDSVNYLSVIGTAIIYPEGEPPVINSPAAAQTVTVYEEETGTLTIDAADAAVYQWYINRNDGLGYVTIDGATRSSYTTSAVTLENDGFTYYCIASNAYGETRSPIFTLEVLEKIDLPQTGDDSHIHLWMMLCLMSCVGMLAITMHGKKSRTE